MELALKYGCHLDTVIAYRKRYLDQTEQQETIKVFLKHSKEVIYNSIIKKTNEKKHLEKLKIV